MLIVVFPVIVFLYGDFVQGWVGGGVKVQLSEIKQFYSLDQKTQMTVIKRRTNCFFISFPLGNQTDTGIKDQ